MLNFEGIPKDTVESKIVDAKDLVENSNTLIDDGSIAAQTDGNVRTNIQFAKFVISQQLLKIPLYISISPEFKVSDAQEAEKEKAKKLLNTNGGSLSLTVKKYFSPKFLSFNDVSFRFNAFSSGNFMNSLDSINKSNKTDFNLVSGLGANFEAVVTGEGIGVLWIESQLVNFKSFGQSYKSLFVGEPKSNFWGFTIHGGLKIQDIIDLKLSYYKSFKSNIESLDKGIYVISIGIGTNFSKFK